MTRAGTLGAAGLGASDELHLRSGCSAARWLHDMSDHERAAAWLELGHFRYARQWLAEERTIAACAWRGDEVEP